MKWLMLAAFVIAPYASMARADSPTQTVAVPSPPPSDQTLEAFAKTQRLSLAQKRQLQFLVQSARKARADVDANHRHMTDAEREALRKDARAKAGQFLNATQLALYSKIDLWLLFEDASELANTSQSARFLNEALRDSIERR